MELPSSISALVLLIVSHFFVLPPFKRSEPFFAGCIFLYLTAAAPNKRSLGATNGLAQTTSAIARSIGPAAATSLYSFSVQHNLLGGYAVYAVLLTLSIFAVLLSLRLPDEVWPEPEEEDTPYGGRKMTQPDPPIRSAI